MSTVIINASPRSDENSNVFLENCKKELLGWNESYDVIDLYDDSVKSIVSDKSNQSMVENVQRTIKKSERLVFIYQVWKNNLPTILEGFIENVFTNGFAFKDNGESHTGLLKDKKATVFAYTPKTSFMEKFLPKDHGVKFLTDDILSYCDVKATPYVFVNTMKFNDNVAGEIQNVTEKGIDHLFKNK